MLNLLISHIEIIVFLFEIGNLCLEVGLNLGDLKLVGVIGLLKLLVELIDPPVE